MCAKVLIPADAVTASASGTTRTSALNAEPQAAWAGRAERRRSGADAVAEHGSLRTWGAPGEPHVNARAQPGTDERFPGSRP